MTLSLGMIGGAAGGPAPGASPPSRAEGPARAAEVVPGSETEAVVVFVTRIINGDTAPLRSPRIHLHAPIQLPHQKINKLDVEGRPQRRKDAWGAPVLVYQRETLAPGSSLVGRWTARATVRRFRWDWQGPAGGGGPSLSRKEQALGLRDGPVLALDDPVIGSAAQEAARGRTNTVGVLEGVFDLVMDRLSYDRDGRWQPAPEVLSSGKGSCSEYSYCFIALCRKNGIPARYVGGIVGRPGAPFHVDRIFHRFPQAHVPGFGWVDFDPTRTERAQNKRLYFGQTPGPMLLLAVGDGGDGSLTGTDYLEQHAWDDRSTRASSLRQAWWFPPCPAKVQTEVKRFRRRLGSVVGPARAALVREALAIGHPLVLPWLDDLLYEPGPRVDAARACLELGGQDELPAIVNCLGRLQDPAGDRQIGELLNAYTGETFGSNRTRWNEWLKARTPRTPLPGDRPERAP
ncbi:MAG TPA: transglutaminase-like domain-containing protein [Verrucomicrobiota bacterium]|nr:transglutaminase-like domain-containing protein [Verrucomicrobiota bacterium]